MAGNLALGIIIFVVVIGVLGMIAASIPFDHR